MTPLSYEAMFVMAILLVGGGGPEKKRVNNSRRHFPVESLRNTAEPSDSIIQRGASPNCSFCSLLEHNACTCPERQRTVQ